jgi:adenylosuccinate synthase
VIGNGVALDPEALLAEIARMAELGVSVTPDNLSIAENATLVLPIHRAIDEAQERLRREPIGTTLRGIGPAYEDKVGRRALRVADLAEPDRLADKLDVLVDHHNAWFRGLGLAPSSRDAMLATLVELAPKILPFVRPVWAELNDAHARGERILFEGSQAVMLDIDWGTYPFVTSSGTIASAAAAGTGLGASKLGHVLGVTKAYATRVGAARSSPNSATRPASDCVPAGGIRRQHRPAASLRMARCSPAASGRLRVRYRFARAHEARCARRLRVDRAVRRLRTRRRPHRSPAHEPRCAVARPAHLRGIRRLGRHGERRT